MYNKVQQVCHTLLKFWTQQSQSSINVHQIQRLNLEYSKHFITSIVVNAPKRV